MSNANASDNLTIGKYKLVTCVATGHSSQVWEVVDNETSRRCAMKLLLPEALKESDAISTLKHEYKVGSSFEHPNIIKYHDVSARRKQAYFTMEMFPAPNLKAQMYNDLRMVQVRCKRLIELVAMALEHMHDRGWLHRDVKPENILMNKSAEVRLIDFSLACRSATILTKVFSRKAGTIQGTRTYMAPEQILGKPLSPQTDIYSLGVTIFEIITGQPPFAGATPNALLLKHLGEPAPAPSSYNPNVTEEMDRIVLRMLSKKPEARQKKLSELLVEFRNVSVFKEAVTDEVQLSEEEKAKQELANVLGERLDSRTDALRTKFGGGSPPKAKPAKPAPKQAAPVSPPARPPAMPAAPQRPMPGMPMPPQMPMMPQYMVPPPMMQPVMMQPPMMPQYMPQQQMPQPGMPLMPPQMVPYPPQSQVPVQAPSLNPATGGILPWVAAPAPVAGAGMPPPQQAQVAPQPVPPATRPAPPPVRPPAPTAPAAARPPAPAAARPPQPAAKPKPPASAATPEQAFKIDDLPGFDSLPKIK